MWLFVLRGPLVGSRSCLCFRLVGRPAGAGGDGEPDEYVLWDDGERVERDVPVLFLHEP